jgi:CRISPR-associated endonuclease/helicase Cas3
MQQLTIEQFPAFFRELHGFDPYPWQQRFAERAVQGDWPGAIDLPTGSGKTACIDVAIFALAAQAYLPLSERTAPQRIFFCVNRRVIVDEAYQRSVKIAKAIWDAERKSLTAPRSERSDRGTINEDASPTIAHVATCLRSLAGSTSNGNGIPPLDALELRGGIYRDNRWARSAMQPTVICSTIDQIGSRLLFRGYGVSENAAPIQAALVAYDSLLLLDEAHISQPFRQTVESVRQFLDPGRWARRGLEVRPLVFVPMTATPTNEMVTRGVITLTDNDRESETLTNRLEVEKLARLEAVADVVKAAVAEAKKSLKGDPKAVGIIVNRVASARAIYAELLTLRKKQPDISIELVIGSMRPVDRDDQQERLREYIGPDRPTVSEQMSVTISTQCLEVGADYDFDVLIAECASLDALRQRFGRLNRAGREIQSEAVILVGKKDTKEDDKLDEFLAVHDTRIDNEDTVRKTALMDDAFGRWLQALDGRKIIVVLDTCHSGGQAGGGAGARGCGPAKGAAPAKGFDPGWLPRGLAGTEFDFLNGEVLRAKDIGQRDAVLLAASMATERAFERPDRGLSVMTHFLLESLQAQPRLTVVDAYWYVRRKVPAYVAAAFPGMTQTPVLVPDDEANKRLLLRP